MKKEEAKKAGDQNDEPGLEQQFAEIKDELLKSVALFATEGDPQSEELLRFILLFASVYNKDFFSDEMASTLLRQVYLETEGVDEAKIEELREESRAGLEAYLGTGPRVATKEEAVVKVRDAGDIYAEVYGEATTEFQANAYQQGDRVNFEMLGQWDSRKCALALYSVNQDVILDELRDRFDIENRARWLVVRDLCVPLWLKDAAKLRTVVDWVAKVAYKDAQAEVARRIGDGTTPPSAAEATSLWHLLVNKVGVLRNLYSQEKGQGEKVAALLGRPYETEKAAKAARKDAWALHGKQRYLLSATFAILGGDYDLALRTVVDSMKDPILGILTCRMLLLQRREMKIKAEDVKKIEDLQQNIYQEHLVERGQRHGDVYLESMGLWGQQKHVQAVNALEARWDLESKQKCLGAGEIFSEDAGVITVVKNGSS